MNNKSGLKTGCLIEDGRLIQGRYIQACCNSKTYPVRHWISPQGGQRNQENVVYNSGAILARFKLFSLLLV